MEEEEKTLPKYKELIEPNKRALYTYQIIIFMLTCAADCYLFYYVEITYVWEWKTYLISYFISVGFLMIVFDWLISIAASCLIKNKGIIASRGISAVIIYGFVGFNRIRCVQ